MVNYKKTVKFVQSAVKIKESGFPLSREWQKESRNETSVKPAKPVAKIVSKWANLR